MPSPRPVPLTIFGIPFGLLGMADCWLVAAGFHLVPVGVGRAMVLVAVLIWALAAAFYLRSASVRGASIAGDLTNPVLGPFASLAVLTPMLAAADALYPYSQVGATVIVDAFAGVTLALGGWFAGEWIYRPRDLDQVHPGYFLPSVAGGFVASVSLSLVGQTGLALLLFGAGLFSWLVIGSIILGRLILGPPLPAPLTPTLAIEVAPAGVATFAAFAMNGGRIDLTVKLLAAYGLLMIAAQLRLLPVYLRLNFMPSFWSFAFSWAAVAFAGEFWLGTAHPSGWRIELWIVLVAITVSIGMLAIRTVTAVRRGRLLPPPAPQTPAAVPPAERPSIPSVRVTAPRITHPPRKPVTRAPVPQAGS